MKICNFLTFAILTVGAAAAMAAPVTYKLDPAHTYPSFAADHMGISVWRGKFDHTSGTVTLDKAAQTGQVKIVVDMASVNFGLESLNKAARSPKLFDVAKYPHATYAGRLDGFVGGKPTKVVGNLTLHGITRPLVLEIKSFKCIPMYFDKSRQRCGADALAHFERDAFGMDWGRDYGFDMTVTLHIQVEALEAKKHPG